MDVGFLVWLPRTIGIIRAAKLTIPVPMGSGMLKCIAMHREYGAWERLRVHGEDTMRLILMEKLIISVIHGITKSR